MTGLDSNVIIRYVTQDEAAQSAAATRLFESFNSEHLGFVSLIALIETVWVLRSSYDASRDQIYRVIETLLRSRGLKVESSDLVWTALDAYLSGKADFGDYLIEHCGRAAGCESTLTFDRNAATTAGMELLR